MSEVRRFLEDLRRQQAGYREMLSVVEEQKKLLTGADVDGLLGLVERKRALLEEIEALERDVAPTKAKWPELRGALEAALIREVEEVVGETRQVLERLVRLEEEGRALMQDRRPAAELKGFMTQKKARGAYGK